MFGKKRIFRALSGVVINANQRSDTYVSGSGSSSSYGGYGGGKSWVSSTVVVTSNIWIRTLSGQEHRLNFERDVPVREGNVIHAVDVLDMNGKEISNGEVLLYNSTTQKWFYTGGLNSKIRNVCPACAFWKIFLGFGITSIFLNAIVGHTTGVLILVWGLLAGIFLAIMYAAWLSGATKGGGALVQANQQLGEYFKLFYSELDEIAKKFVAPVQQNASGMIDQRPEVAAIAKGTAKAFCTSCGTGIAENTAFCGSCGTKLAAAV